MEIKPQSVRNQPPTASVASKLKELFAYRIATSRSVNMVDFCIALIVASPDSQTATLPFSTF